MYIIQHDVYYIYFKYIYMCLSICCTTSAVRVPQYPTSRASALPCKVSRRTQNPALLPSKPATAEVFRASNATCYEQRECFQLQKKKLVFFSLSIGQHSMFRVWIWRFQNKTNMINIPTYPELPPNPPLSQLRPLLEGRDLVEPLRSALQRPWKLQNILLRIRRVFPPPMCSGMKTF